MAALTLTEAASAPETPSAGAAHLYPKTDGRWYSKDDAGTEYLVSHDDPLLVGDGGTGVITFADAGVLIGNGTGAIQVTGAGTSGQILTSNGAGVDPTFQAAAGLLAATQAEQEAGSSITVGTTPGRQQFHPSAPKVWLVCDAAGNISGSYNVTSITDTAVGVVDVTIATDFSSANYARLASYEASNRYCEAIATDAAPAAGTVRLECFDAANGALVDPSRHHFAALGDQ